MDNILYDCDGIVVRNTVFEDVEYLSRRLRKSDVEEIWSSHNHDPYSALCLCFYRSSVCFTVTYAGIPVCMFGVNGESIIGSKGVVWMLGSDELTKHRIRFARHSKRIIGVMLNIYPFLYNFVHDKNKESIDWLKRCGAKISEPMPYGVEKDNFRFFCFERN